MAQTDDLDEAEKFMREHNLSHAYIKEMTLDESAMTTLRKRVDWSLLPLLCGTYLLQYIDKQAMGYGAVFDLFETTGITGSQYSWLASIFYFAYLVCEWPVSYLAQRYPTGKIIATFVICWGTVITCTAACQNFTGFAICRFLLGAFEAPITPCFMMIVGSWYTKEEQPARAGLFYCFNGFGSVIGGILFYSVGNAKGWDVWRIIFIICGGVTIIWGIVLFFFLPDNIFAAKKFTTEERAMLVAWIYGNRTGILNKKIKTAQVAEALLDPQIWVLFLFTLLNETVNGGIANFGKLIVKGFSGDDALLTTAYGIPYGAWVAAFIFTGPFPASKFKNIRTYIMAIWVLPTLAAACMFWKLDRSGKRNPGLLMAYYIVSTKGPVTTWLSNAFQCPSFVGSLVLALQMPAMNVGGYTKRVTSTAFVFLAYCIGNICGPQAFRASEAPIYQTGCKVIIACTAGQVVLAFVLRFLLIRRNKRRDAAAASQTSSGAIEHQDHDELYADLTDLQNPKFRYSY